MRCANCGQMNREGASFCSNCGEPLEVACPTCATPHVAGATFCSNCGARLDRAEISDPLARYLPAELQAKLEAARTGRTMAGERRTITMLFADVEGSTAAAEQLDPEEWAEIVNGAFEHLIRPVYRYEGTLARIMGDAVLAFFGAPIAHEDDPERAVMAGLEMLAATEPYSSDVRSRWGVDFDVRVGINTGLVVVGEVGSDLRVEYSALGDAVNVAARMEQTAAPGTLQVTEATYRLVESLFDAQRLEPVAAKGKSKPVVAYRVTGVRARPSSLRGILGHTIETVGREAELQTLHGVIDSVRQGKGQICSLIGDAGVGKSKLAATLKSALSAQECVVPWSGAHEIDSDVVRWAEAKCLSYDVAVPYAPFIDLFDSLFEIDRATDAATQRTNVEAAVAAVLPDDPAAAMYLEIMLGIPPAPDRSDFVGELEPPVLQKRVFSAVTDYIEACSRASPGVLLIEDLHWADPVSLALLEDLMRATDRSMLAIMALMRPYRDDASWEFHEVAARKFSHRYTAVRLRPLDKHSTRAMVAGLLEGGRLPDGVYSMIETRSDGNPFFVEEIVRELTETGALTRAGEDWTLVGDLEAIHVPTGVAGLLTARMDRLDESSRLVLQLASVLGREFGFSQLRELTTASAPTESALYDLLHRDLIVEESRTPDRTYAFRHALIQEAAYETILLKTRRSLHAQIAEHLIARDGEPHDIARHLIESRQEEQAVQYLAEAGDRASRAMSLADAIRYYDQALMWATDAEHDLARHIYEGLGAAYTLIPDLTEASASYQRMLEFGRAQNEPSVQITALNRLGFTAAALGGDYDTATAHLEEARRLAEQYGDGEGLAEYHINSCLIASTRGDMEKAAAHDAETVRLGEEVGAGHLVVHGLLQRVLSLVHATDYDEARRTFDKALAVTAGTTNPNLLAMLAAAEYFFLMRDGNVRAAWELSRDAADHSVQIGSSSAGSLALAAGSTADLIGDVENALVYLSQALRFGEESGQLFNAASAAASMARIYLELGIDDDETAALEKKALAYTKLPLGETLETTVLVELARSQAIRRKLSEAEDLLRRALAGSSAVKNLEMPGVLFELASVRIAQGDDSSAAPYIDEGAEFAAQRGMALYLPVEAMTRGLLLSAEGRGSEAVDLLTAGADQASEMGMLGLQRRIQVLLAEVLTGEGHLDDASAAAEVARRLGAEQAARILDPSMKRAFVAAAAALLPESTSVATTTAETQGRGS